METVSADETRNSLIEQYRRFTENLVVRFIKMMNLPTELHAEFVSAGYLGLVEAEDRFDASRGVDFRSYAYLRIKSAVIDAVRQCSDFNSQAYTYRKVLQACLEVRDYDLMIREVQPERELSREQKLAQILDYAAKGALAFRLAYDESEEEVADAQEGSLNPEEELEVRQGKRTIREMVDALPEKERLIIREYYFNGKTFSEMAEECDGLSKSWISRLHDRALDRLKKELVG